MDSIFFKPYLYRFIDSLVSRAELWPAPSKSFIVILYYLSRILRRSMLSL